MICKKCGKDSPLDNFYRNKSYKSGYAAQCKDCAKAYGRKKYSENPDVMRERQLKHKFNKSQAWYEQTLKAQGGVCQICKRPPEENGRKNFPVDHDHATGKVRGILCQSCNHMLGNAKDNIINLQNAILYLSKYA
jgi:hypothetical protein